MPENWLTKEFYRVSPSGKAAGFGPATRRFESFHPRKKCGWRAAGFGEMLELPKHLHRSCLFVVLFEKEGGGHASAFLPKGYPPLRSHP